MKKWGKAVGLSLLFLSVGYSLKAEVSEITRSRVKVTLLTALENSKAQGRVKDVKASFICEVADWCFDSAYLTPGFGNEQEAGIKLICAAYGESGFHPLAKHRNKKKDKRYLWDVGIMQVNSIHWIPPTQEPTWREFCDKMGYDYDLQQIWNPLINIQFAAVINEMLLKAHLKPYRFCYSGRQDQCFIYKELKKAIK